MSARFCGHCGAPAAPNATFCPHCGTALPPAPAGAGAATAPAPEPAATAMSAVTPVACPRCGAINSPSAQFCAQCAQPLAAGAPVAPMMGAGAMPVYALATPAQAAAALQHKTGKTHPWFLIGGGVLVSMIALAVVAARIAPTPGPCGHGCQPPPPPSSPALAALNRYTSTTYGYSLEYNSADLAPATMDATSIGWAGTLRSNGAPVSWDFSGNAANGRTAQDIVDSTQQGRFQDAGYLYTIPGAEMGYMPGYGKVYSMTLTPASGQTLNGRLIIMAAIRDGVAVELVGIGPYRQTTYSDGHPNPAQTPIVNWFNLNVNTVTWKGEAPL